MQLKTSVSYIGYIKTKDTEYVACFSDNTHAEVLHHFNQLLNKDQYTLRVVKQITIEEIVYESRVCCFEA